MRIVFKNNHAVKRPISIIGIYSEFTNCIKLIDGRIYLVETSKVIGEKKEWGEKDFAALENPFTVLAFIK